VSRRRKSAAPPEPPPLGRGQTLVLDAHVLNDYLLIAAVEGPNGDPTQRAAGDSVRGPRWRLVDAVVRACPRIAWSRALANQVPNAAGRRAIDGTAHPIPVQGLLDALRRLGERKAGVLHQARTALDDVCDNGALPREDAFLAPLAWACQATYIVTEDVSHDRKRGIPSGPLRLTRRGEARDVWIVDVSAAQAQVDAIPCEGFGD
jgi:hypothetical protein